jgi:hypothetical protein
VNRNKAKGTRWECSVRDYLNETHGKYVDNWRQAECPYRNPADPHNVFRPNQDRAHDLGDVHAWPFVLQLKDVAKPSAPKWIRAARRQARFAGFPFYCAVHKVRNRGVLQGRVHFDVRSFTKIRLVLGMDSREMANEYDFTFAVRGVDTSKWYFTCSVRSFAQMLSDVRVAGQY